MDKRIILPLATAMALSATSAFAEVHEVFLMEGGFFPEITYLNPGDTVTFINYSGYVENVVAADASWSTIEIPDGGSDVLIVTETTTLAFVYDENSEYEKYGTLTFDPAPLE